MHQTIKAVAVFSLVVGLCLSGKYPMLQNLVAGVRMVE